MPAIEIPRLLLLKEIICVALGSLTVAYATVPVIPAVAPIDFDPAEAKPSLDDESELFTIDFVFAKSLNKIFDLNGNKLAPAANDTPPAAKYCVVFESAGIVVKKSPLVLITYSARLPAVDPTSPLY